MAFFAFLWRRALWGATTGGPPPTPALMDDGGLQIGPRVSLT
jgi:hypothetical protein